MLLKNTDVLWHLTAKEELAALPPPPESKIPKEKDEDVTLRVDGDVALDWQVLLSIPIDAIRHSTRSPLLILSPPTPHPVTAHAYLE